MKKLLLLFASVMTLNASLTTSASLQMSAYLWEEADWLKNGNQTAWSRTCAVTGSASAACPPGKKGWRDFWGLLGGDEESGAVRPGASAGYGWVESHVAPGDYVESETYHDPSDDSSKQVTAYLLSEGGASASFSDVIYLHPTLLSKVAYVRYSANAEWEDHISHDYSGSCADFDHTWTWTYYNSDCWDQTASGLSPLIAASVANTLSATVAVYGAQSNGWHLSYSRFAYTGVTFYDQDLNPLKNIKYWTKSGTQYPVADGIYATPEPVSCGLVAAGLGVIGWKRRRRDG